MDSETPGSDDEREVDFSDEGVPVLPDRTPDGTDFGWGDRTWGGREDTNDERLIAERPPHW